MNAAVSAIEHAVDSADVRDASQRAAAVGSVSPAMIDDALFGAAASAVGTAADGELIGVGVGVSAGLAVGRVCCTAEEVAVAWTGDIDAVFVADHTSPTDDEALRRCVAVITRSGGIASHAAIVARQLGIPGVTGLQVLPHAGDQVLVDGTTGEVRRLNDLGVHDRSFGSALMLGSQRFVGGDGDWSLPEAVRTVLTWADEIVGDRLVVRCNADRGEEVSRAAALGARGVGLCRSEFQLGASATVLEAALGDDAESLDAIRVALRDALVPVLDAAGNEVVRVRLLDAPSHEFDLGLTEANPMLGTRGVRALLVSEQFAGYQARAIAEALDIHRAAGGSATVSVTVPMVAMPTELGLVAAVLREHLSDSVEIGVMIETPRAALTAGALAATASYFSFGTNDLTQLVYGLSRDDSDQLLVRYRELGVIDRSPFESLDPVGVARLIALAIDTGRSVQPMLRFGLCGEQGADPASIAMALHLGVGEVSVAPARVPTARMAAAHAVLAGRGSA